MTPRASRPEITAADRLHIRAMAALVSKAITIPDSKSAPDLLEQLVDAGLAFAAFDETQNEASIDMLGITATHRGLSARALLEAWGETAMMVLEATK